MSPLSVVIVNASIPLIVGVDQIIVCEVTGSRPSPSIQWWVDDHKVETHKTDVSNSQSVKKNAANRTRQHAGRTF